MPLPTIAMSDGKIVMKNGAICTSCCPTGSGSGSGSGGSGSGIDFACPCDDAGTILAKAFLLTIAPGSGGCSDNCFDFSCSCGSFSLRFGPVSPVTVCVPQIFPCGFRVDRDVAGPTVTVYSGSGCTGEVVATSTTAHLNCSLHLAAGDTISYFTTIPLGVDAGGNSCSVTIFWFISGSATYNRSTCLITFANANIICTCCDPESAPNVQGKGGAGGSAIATPQTGTC